MNNKYNPFNLSIKRIKNLKVNKERLMANSDIFYIESKSNLYKISNRGKNEYNSFSITLSDHKIERILFLSDYYVSEYKFNNFFEDGIDEYDKEIQIKFLKIINKLIYLGVLYGEISDMTTKVVTGQHFGTSKEYSWIYDLDEPVYKGDILEAETQKGNCLIKVINITTLENVDRVKKKIIRKISI